ncbi:matrixin family metalloprotease [Acinetobacter junii]|uniref:matrixin family metalloprotease n=1 Tax=Acinetobacter junii TaxID=40215 RepID=UPI0032138707
MSIPKFYNCIFKPRKMLTPPNFSTNVKVKAFPKFLTPYYSFFGPRWKKNNLTFVFMNYNLDSFNEEQLKNAFRQAIKIWVQHAPNLSITESLNPNADIKIGFFSGSHGKHSVCKKGFNSTIYAHSFEPPSGFDNDNINGQIHLNSQTHFTLNPNDHDAIDLVTIFAHELGHALGIDHSGYQDALMKASCTLPHRYLGEDDINAIQRLFP